MQVDTLLPLRPPEQKGERHEHVHADVTDEKHGREVGGHQESDDQERDEEDEDCRVEVEFVLALLAFFFTVRNRLHEVVYDNQAHAEAEQVAHSQDDQQVVSDDISRELIVRLTVWICSGRLIHFLLNNF